MNKIPVILDTDIGLDVDDVWALAFLLCCPEVDIRLIVTDTGDTTYSAAIVCKLLDLAGRSDIPVGIGIPLTTTAKTHLAWLGDYTVSDYTGEVITDGVGAMINEINASPEVVKIISIGPVPNLAHALQRDPTIVNNSHFVGMHGSLKSGYLGAPKPHREYNVFAYAQAAQRVFEADWSKTITPLDTCGLVSIQGENFIALTQSSQPLVQAVMDNHFEWAKVVDEKMTGKIDLQSQSSTLYDTVAVHLAFSEAYLGMQDLGVRVTDSGRTLIDNKAKQVRCAMLWQDKTAFEDYVTQRLLAGPVKI